MKKKLPSWIFLMLVCVITAGLLAGINAITEFPIARRAQEAAFAARQEAFPSADSFAEMEVPEGSPVEHCYQALKSGDAIGYVVQLTVAGCQGPIEIQAGFDLDGSVTAISCGGSAFKETAGLGAKVKEPQFREQFSGKPIPVKLGESIDAVTGASISSGAVVSGVNTAGYYVQEMLSPSAALDLPEDAHFGGVLPGATTKEAQDHSTSVQSGIDAIYTSDAGCVVYASGHGRNGSIQVQVGVAHSGQVAGVYIDPEMHKETKGLGDAIENSYFWSQFLGKTGPFISDSNIDAISGATISSEAVIECVNRAVREAAPYLDETKATDISGWFSGIADTVPKSEQHAVAIKAEKVPQVVKTFSGITVIRASEWEEKYPEIYASHMANDKKSSTHDYVEDYPMIGTLYEGMAFNTYYESARGHAYTVKDVMNTGRPHKLANCFTCKTPDFTAMVNNMGYPAYSIPADEDFLRQINEPVSCYNCHANKPGELVITHTYLADAMGSDLNKVDAATLSCAQCHVEYYFSPVTKATVLPYTSLSTMTPDAILDYFNNSNVNGQPFADYTNPRTGVRQIKVQHPEFETFLGEGSVHRSTFTCADCHMPEATTISGELYTSHYYTSPLKNEALIKNTCSECHTDLVSEVKAIQEDMERRTYAIGYELEFLTERLAKAVESGEYTEEELNAIRAVARDAQFYWDFVFVENSEGAHNSALDHQCLDKAEALLNEALGMFKN